jgi:small GTP-binding protein
MGYCWTGAIPGYVTSLICIIMSSFVVSLQTPFAGLAPLYYRSALGAIVVYDITSRSSFERAQSWVEELQSRASSSLVIVLMGNKADLESKRAVRTEDARAFADEMRIAFYESSAKSDINVKEVFMVRRVLALIQSHRQTC